MSHRRETPNPRKGGAVRNDRKERILEEIGLKR